MPLSRDDVQSWLDRYIAAWKSYERDDIVPLFTDDCEYRYHPYDDEATVGGEALAKSWIEPDRIDKPGSWDAHYEVFAVDGDRAVATGTSDYLNDDGSIDRRYYNCFVMTFADDGRCSSFTEWYMSEPSGE